MPRYLERILIGAILLAVFAALLYMDHFTGRRWGVSVLYVLLVTGGLIEFYRMMKLTRAETLVGTTCGLALVSLDILYHGHPDTLATGLASILFLLLVPSLVLKRRRAEGGAPSEPSQTTFLPVSRQAGAMVLGLLYVWFLFSYLHAICHLQVVVDSQAVAGGGLALVFYFVAVTKSMDMGGYLIGKPLGRRRILPAVSPTKSVEGVIGGVGLAVAVAVLGALCLNPVDRVMTVAGAMILGTVLAAASLAGDLVESRFKREAGVKDSGGWLSQFGGVLDVIDSLLLAAPFGYYYFVFFGANVRRLPV